MPLLDKDGSKLFLTLKQADKIVRGIPSLLSSSSTVTVANSDEDEDDVIAVTNYSEDIGIMDPNLLHNLCSSNALSCRLPMVWDWQSA